MVDIKFSIYSSYLLCILQSYLTGELHDWYSNLLFQFIIEYEFYGVIFRCHRRLI
jgi:hypothetical protein